MHNSSFLLIHERNVLFETTASYGRESLRSVNKPEALHALSRVLDKGGGRRGGPERRDPSTRELSVEYGFLYSQRMRSKAQPFGKLYLIPVHSIRIGYY